MKKLFKYVIPCLAVTFMMTSCYSTMDDKASIDAQFAQYANPVMNSTIASATTFETGTATASVGSLENVQEVGFQLSTDASFSSYDTYVCEEVSESFSTSFEGLEEQTTYYVRSYVFTKTGIAVYGEATSFTTPKSPIYEIEGTYSATTQLFNFDTGEFEPGYTNKVTISYVEGSTTEINITNLYNKDETLTASYDPETGEIVIPAGQLIMDHKSYGPVTLVGVGVNTDGYSFTDEVKLKFTALGGKIDNFIWGTKVMEVYFLDILATSLSHDD